MRRFLVSVAVLAIVFGTARGEGKPRKARALSKNECDRICVRIVECAGMPHQSSTVAETLICSDDCVLESKDAERRPGWLCASRAEGCDALKACNPGGKTAPAKQIFPTPDARARSALRPRVVPGASARSGAARSPASG